MNREAQEVEEPSEATNTMEMRTVYTKHMGDANIHINKL